MDKFIFPNKEKKVILALGAESAGNFSVYKNNKIYFSSDFGDLLEEKNWKNFQKNVLQYLKNNKIKPDVTLSDLHPLFKTTTWGEKLATKFEARFVQIQHHHAHIFSAIGDKIIQDTRYKIQDTIYGIALDGTGFGADEKIWGGEIFKIKMQKSKCKIIERIGHLENQILLGGELAIQEPARILIGILYKIFSKSSSPACGKACLSGRQGCRVLATGERIKNKKNIYSFVKKYYSKNEFELLHNQLKQNFNCTQTSSAGRVLDAVSLLLGFSKNERKYKHEPIDKLQKNSTTPYSDLKPKIIFDKKEKKYILNTTYLFNYVINYLHKRDKKRLAATAQLYIAEGLYEIINMQHATCNMQQKNVFISGGIANNKIISKYLISHGAYASKNIYPVKSGKIFNGVPLGDAGISFGQIAYFLLTISKPNITASQIKFSN